MAVVKELLRGEEKGAISFGDYTLKEKAILDLYEHCGDVYKVKTCVEATRLEKNGLFTYESVPGSAVFNFMEKENGVSFLVESSEDIQITLELDPEATYGIYLDDKQVGWMETNRSGKISISVQFSGQPVSVKVIKR